MPGFSSQDCFIEASAGTGKTYTIEQIVKQLVCEEGIPLKEILIVSFTNAATSELKERIRKLLHEEGMNDLGEESIYTLHGFCQKQLKDLAFEATFPFEVVEPSHDAIERIVKDNLKGVLPFLHPFQVERLLSFHRQDHQALVSHLVRLISLRRPIKVGRAFEEINRCFQEQLPTNRDYFLTDLLSLAPCYGKMCDRKKEIKPEIKQGLIQLSMGRWIDSPLGLFHEENRLKREIPSSLFYPGLVERLVPLIQEALNPYALIALIAEPIRERAEQIIAENEWIFFDDLIQRMLKNLSSPSFVQNIRQQFKAVIIDEFQDTDQDQWKIFSNLFLGHCSLYLVGDPKQAIYRFRHADIYTYLAAKKEVGHVKTLDTNYRSTPALVQGLNYLFSDLSFPLPRMGVQMKYEPVKAGKVCENLMPPIVLMEAADEDALFQQINRAIQAHPGLSAAVLVRDRYQAQRFQAQCPFPVRLRRARSLLDSPAIPFMESLLEAIDAPRHSGQLLQGRLHAFSLEDIWRWRQQWEEQGLLATIINIRHEIAPYLMKQSDGEVLYHDLLQVAEILEERQEDDLLEGFDRLLQEEGESPTLRGHQLCDQSRVEVMTLHMSKGLEFDLVFPVGLSLPNKNIRDLVYSDGVLTFLDEAWQAHEQEVMAELYRQMYVACTRPKKRLYLTVIEGVQAPIDDLIKGKIFPKLDEERVLEQASIPLLTSPPILHWRGSSKPIVSFTSLSKQSSSNRIVEKQIAHPLPSGREVGVVLHRILEYIPFNIPLQASIIQPFIAGTCLEPHLEAVISMIETAFNTQLPAGFTLVDVAKNKILKELSFLYPFEEGMCKGVIDLVFEHKGVIYIIDWKSNNVEGSLEEEMVRHQYPLQAQLYREAIRRFLHKMGMQYPIEVIYFFLRKGSEGVVLV